MSLKNQLPTLSKLYSNLERIPENFKEATDIDSYFYHIILSISTAETRLVCLSKSSNKTSFIFKVFKFDSSKFQQRCFLVEEISKTTQNLASTLYCLHKLPEQHDKAKKIQLLQFTNPQEPHRLRFF